MSCVPVSGRSLLIAMMACLLLPVAAQAGRIVLIRYAEQLEKNKEVRQFVQPYALLSSANVVYAQCGTELGITPEQQTYLKTKFEEVSRAYLKAYEDAYYAQVQAPSGKEMTDQYVKALTDQQQAAVNRMALAIHQKKCKDSQIVRFADYVETLRQQELGIASPAAAAPAAAPVAAPATPPQN